MRFTPSYEDLERNANNLQIPEAARISKNELPWLSVPYPLKSRFRPAGCASVTNLRGSRQSVHNLLLEELRDLFMDIQVLQHIESLPNAFGCGRVSGGGVCRIAVSSSVNADKQRIFQLLTIPEYIEAWLRLPGDYGLQNVVSRTNKGFRIEVGGSPATAMTITGLYMILRRSKLRFTWHKQNGEDEAPSLVMIRLHGEFARTRLCLDHIGLKSEEERVWHEKLWKASLDALSSLFK